jgi:type IV pilus assembly protein PilE
MSFGLLAACSLATLTRTVVICIRSNFACRRSLHTNLSLKHCAGFSLIELMIALAIATILAVASVPSYRDHLMRSRIPEATSGLLLTGMRLEQYYQDHRSYASTDNSACGVTLPQPVRFAFSCTVASDGQSFLVSARGQKDGPMAGFAYTLDQLGVQRTTALPGEWGDAPANCWVEKRGAGC